jgi:DNA modification methylase
MKLSFENFYKILKPGADCFIDIGDSKFKNTHIPADKIFENIAEEIGFKTVDKIVLRNRFSKDGTPLKQYLLHFKKPLIQPKNLDDSNKSLAGDLARNNWQIFQEQQPYKEFPYSKRNWGNSLHSLCSYQGKLKPSIAHFLISMFTSEGMTVLDTFSGVGTIPFEGTLQGRKTIGNDISKVALANTIAKIGNVNADNVYQIIENLNTYIYQNLPGDDEINSIDINFNKAIQEYYHIDTLKEIVAARNFFLQQDIEDPNYALVFASLLHILHGNRPYALSRTSHPITPFAPRGEYLYKNVINKLKEKVTRSLKEKVQISLLQEDTILNYEGQMILDDVFNLDNNIRASSVDSIITSPPFFDSTKFYLANWIRLWFSGWDKKDFEIEKQKYLETKQIKNIEIYDDYFKKCHRVLKNGGTLIMHLGVSKKANMGEMILPYANKYFDVIGMFIENVAGSEKFGIKDQGSVTGHQFLFLEKL